MPRPLREDFDGCMHHVFARGNGRQALFLDDEDRGGYLRMLGWVTLRMRWRCLAYCLMGNHVHVLVETPQGNLGRGMQRLHGAYARRFNDRHGRSGHVFQGRYGSKRIESEAQVWATLVYIARNPVTAGICATPEAWPWSSHLATLGEEPAPPWLDVGRALELLEPLGGDPRRRYAELTAAGR